jgi:hypothetical protein
MTDEEILQRIQNLVEEEHALNAAGAVGHERLVHVEETLDQCWDLLRQRRARREFSQDESAVTARDIGTVERYRQ